MRIGAAVVAVILAGLLAVCGDDAPTLASPKAGKVTTVIPRTGIDGVSAMLVGPDGTIYVGGSRGAVAYPKKGEERSLYRAANELNHIAGIALGNGVVYLSERDDYTIRAITRNGGVLNVAGNGDSAIPADGSLAAYSPLACPTSLYYDAKASALVVREGTQFRRIDKDGRIQTGGIGGKTADELCKIEASGLSVADNGDYLFARPTFVARCCDDIVFYPPEGPDANPRAFEHIAAIAYDEQARVIYVADQTRIKRIAADGRISVVAGNGDRSNKFSGEGGPPLEAGLGPVRALAVDTKGNLYLASAFPPGIRVIGAPIR
jgi:hypothetical protein